MKLLTVERAVGHLASILGFTASPNLYIKILEIGTRKQFNIRGTIIIPSTDAHENEDPQEIGAPVPPPNPNWKWLSPTEEAIVRAARPCPEWKTADVLATEICMPLDRDFRAILKNLVDRQILQSHHGRGYCLQV